METTTTELLESTTQTVYSNLLSAADILSDSSDNVEHFGSNQITFEIPSNLDLERIKSLDNFTNLLHRFGNSVYTNTITDGGDGGGSGLSANQFTIDGYVPSGSVIGDTHPITSDQISNSVVLNMADLKNSASSGLERFFDGTDMNIVINYLWIGVVTSLIILSAVFIVFSCYFYRKFREWKKCNKDIRSQMNNDLYPGNGIAYAGPSGELLVGHPSENGYYQMESPPCYTIATGLPTYDEALNHHQQDRYTYGMKFVYPTTLPSPTTAGHQHPNHSTHSQNQNGMSSPRSCWEKDDLALTHNIGSGNENLNNNNSSSNNNNNNNDGKKAVTCPDATNTAAYHRWQDVQTTAATIALLQHSNRGKDSDDDDGDDDGDDEIDDRTRNVCLENVIVVKRESDEIATRQSRDDDTLSIRATAAAAALDESDFCTDIVVVS